MPYRQGDVVLVPFPFTNQSESKQRPALVVSANWYNQSKDDCIMVPITSSMRGERDEVKIHGMDVQLAGLLFEGAALAGKIFTIHQGCIRRRLGGLPRGTFNNVLTRVIETLKD